MRNNRQTWGRRQWRIVGGSAFAALLSAGAASGAALADGHGHLRGPGHRAQHFRLGPAGSAFYDPPHTLPRGKPGTLIWARRIPAPKGAVAYKVLYKSKDIDGRTDAVSGLVIAPKGKPPKRGRNVVAWAHGTLGGARKCAPSTPNDPARNLRVYYSYTDPYTLDVGVPGLTKLLKAGDVVTATDYQGLGGPGVLQYTVGRTEANNVVDSVKAARALPVGAGKRVAVLGWSQGGGAAIFTGQQAEAAYAKPLRVIGVAALAPAANTAPDIEGKVAAGPTNSLSLGVTTVQELNLIRGFAAAYSNLHVSDVITPAGMPAERALNVECTIQLGDVIQELGVNPRTFFNFPFSPAWKQRFQQNTAGRQSTVAPVLTVQGTNDSVVNPNGTAQYIQRACRFHQPVQFTLYPGATHQTIPFAAQHQYLPWIAARFAGRRAPSNCSP